MVASSNSMTGQETVGRSQQNQPQALLFSLEMFFFGCGWMACCCSVLPSCPTLWSHGLQHSRSPCPSQSHRVCSNPCPVNQRFHPTISSSVIHFSCLQSFPISGSFQMSQVAKYWSFSFSPSSEYSGLTSFRMDWLDLLAVQGTLKSLLQHHSSKASIFQCSAFLMVQLSHSYMTNGKTIALTWWTFVLLVY